MEQLWQDLRVAARGLLKDRAFSVTTVATLALCLAANIAIFAVVDGVLLKPLPFAEPDRLVSLHNSYPGAGAHHRRQRGPGLLRPSRGAHRPRGAGHVSPERHDDRRRQPRRRARAGAASSPRRSSRCCASRHFAAASSPEDEAEVGQDQKVLLTHGFWQRQFGGADSALGQSLRVNGVPMTIDRRAAAGLQVRRSRDSDRAGGGVHAGGARGRSAPQQQLAAGRPSEGGRDHRPGARASCTRSTAPTTSASRSFARCCGTRASRRAPSASRSIWSGTSGRTLTLLWGGALVVLIIGCVNVTNLVLVRSTAAHARAGDPPRARRQHGRGWPVRASRRACWSPLLEGPRAWAWAGGRWCRRRFSAWTSCRRAAPSASTPGSSASRSSSSASSAR